MSDRSLFLGDTWYRCLRLRVLRADWRELAMVVRTVSVELLRRRQSAVGMTTVASTCTLTVALHWGESLLRRRGSEAEPRHQVQPVEVLRLRREYRQVRRVRRRNRRSAMEVRRGW